jgi:hypothetical protein
MRSAEQVAEARLHLERVREAQMRALSDSENKSVIEDQISTISYNDFADRLAAAVEVASRLERLERYQRRTRSSFKTALRRFDHVVARRQATRQP